MSNPIIAPRVYVNQSPHKFIVMRGMSTFADIYFFKNEIKRLKIDIRYNTELSLKLARAFVLAF